jgi:hypothetical protein
MLLIVFITQNEARPGHDIDYKTGYFLREIIEALIQWEENIILLNE